MTIVHEKEYCSCVDWRSCACGSHQVSPHCMYCCKNLTDAQIEQARIADEKWLRSWRYKWLRVKDWLMYPGGL